MYYIGKGVLMSRESLLPCLPCKDCLCLGICRNDIRGAFPNTLTQLANKCCLLFDYLKLKDMGLEEPPNDMPFKDRLYYTRPFSKRVIGLCILMKWTDKFDLSRYYDIAFGGGS